MKYRVTFLNRGEPIEGFEDATLTEAQEAAVNFVHDRMDAFGEDREALESYGYIDAENAALAIGEDGGYVYVPDGYRIEVTPIDPDNG